MKLVLPAPFLFGYWGSAPFPWLLILSRDYKDHAALIAHERCHQSQQRRDGTLTFWWRYLTNKSHRLDYEVEAYKVWIEVAPNDRYMLAQWLSNNYGFDLTPMRALMLLESKD